MLPFYNYVNMIAQTNKPISKAVRQALDRVPFYLDKFNYNADYPNAIINFIESFIYLQKGGTSSKPMKLQTEQKFWISLLGLEDKDGLPVINDIALVLGAGSGKSTFVAALSLAVMMVGSNTGQDVLIMSNSVRQSQETFRTASEMARDERSVLGELTKLNVLAPVINKIKYAATNSQIEVKTMDNKTADGVNVRLAIFDEMHGYRTNVIENIRKSSAPKRKATGFTTMYITTNGQTRGAVFDEYMDHWYKILNGKLEEWTTFPMIYEMDSIDEVSQPELYEKAMPFIKSISSPRIIVDLLNKAEGNPVALNEILAKSFNLPQTEFTALFHDNELKSDMQTKPKGTLQDLAYIGWDMSAVNDLSAVSILRFDEDNKPIFDVIAWLPEETYKSRITPEQRQNYDNFISSGKLRLMPGTTIDETEAFNQLDEYINSNRLVAVGFAGDGYYSRNFQRLIKEYYGEDSLQITRQTVTALSDPFKHIVSLFRSGDTPIIAPLIAWSLSNVRAKTDANGNIYPNKSKAAEKIDVVLAMINAYIVYQNDQANPTWTGWSY